MESRRSVEAVELKGTLVMQSYASFAGTMGTLTVAAAASWETLAHAPRGDVVGYGGAGAAVPVIVLVAVPNVVL